LQIGINPREAIPFLVARNTPLLHQWRRWVHLGRPRSGKLPSNHRQGCTERDRIRDFRGCPNTYSTLGFLAFGR